jgi:hypothetical protein
MRVLAGPGCMLFNRGHMWHNFNSVIWQGPKHLFPNTLAAVASFCPMRSQIPICIDCPLDGTTSEEYHVQLA